jgi:hypothetical protein
MGNRLDARWHWAVLIFWALVSAFLVYQKWAAIHWFSLGDTDDNLRMMQVRALLAGQSWYDLRQYRLDPPFGADIHWSRLVDLPIAGIKLALTPLLGGRDAEKAAVAIAPLLPMALAMLAVAVSVRRLIAPRAFILALPILVCAHSARNMWSPLRIDHHGWQLAFLAVAAMALTDPKRARGGAILGAATALSFAIGLEMLLYLALAGGLLVLMWIRDGGEARRVATYGASLAGGCSLAFLLFASYANRAPVCDALSPVWLSAFVVAGALAVALSFLRTPSWLIRLGAAGAGGAILAAGFALAWPHCLGRLEGVSPEADALWLSNVREALPVYRHGLKTALAIGSLPVLGLIGYALMLWQSRRGPARLLAWAALALLALLSALLLLWQSRAAPAAQLLALPGATALAWAAITWFLSLPYMLARVFGAVAAFVVISGIGPQYAASLIPEPKRANGKAINRANNRCPTLPALRPVALQPKGYVLTFVDLGPRLIAVTHHDAVAGPYHRNDEDIVDIMQAFRGSAENARRIVERRGVDYVLICPGLSESTIYATRAKQGFYVQLNKGQVPAWLERVKLPANSPYKMWRVRR